MINYKKDALIYIDPLTNSVFDTAISNNYRSIVDSFNQFDIKFIYLPKLFTDRHINKVLGYNHPYLKHINQIDAQKLYYIISNNLKLKLNSPALIYLSENGDLEQRFDVPSPNLFSSSNELILFIEKIKRRLHPSIETSFSIARDSKVLFRKESTDFDGILEIRPEDLDVDSPKKKLSKTSYSIKIKKKTPDDLFEKAALIIPDDLQKQIEELSKAGYLSHLIKYLEILQESTQKLSRLKITEDYKLYLIDYEMKEVKMNTLPKALYFLFINHPEGISFKALPDYRLELMEIYKKISIRENPLKARLSINRLTDPFNNSVHEKCSRIRIAFLKVVAEDIAQNYYITGIRGEPKQVLLNRELVIYDK